MIDFVRIPSPRLARLADPRKLRLTSEERRYKYAYETPEGRWLIERAYGACGGGWNITDTTGEYVGPRHGVGTWWDGTPIEDPWANARTLEIAKAFVTEFALMLANRTTPRGEAMTDDDALRQRAGDQRRALSAALFRAADDADALIAVLNEARLLGRQDELTAATIDYLSLALRASEPKYRTIVQAEIAGLTNVEENGYES